MLDVELSNVTLNYGFKNILDGATFQVNSGDKVAIEIGRASCRERV